MTQLHRDGADVVINYSTIEKIEGCVVPHALWVYLSAFRNGDGGGITLALVHPDTPRGYGWTWSESRIAAL